MDWTQIITLIGVNITLIAALAGLVIWVMNKLASDVNSLGNRLDGHAMRIDQLYQMSCAQADRTEKRMDQLYTMFIDLVKEGKNGK